MIVYRKSFNELEQDVLQRLSNTKITNTSDGSRALSLIRSINTIIQSFYNDLDSNIEVAFISKAQNGFIDLIGELLNCTRNPGETDDNYRYRIVNQINVVAGGNKKAIEIETNDIPGVRKIVFKNFTRGIGSYSAYVITDTIDGINAAVDQVQNILDNKSSFGIKGVAEPPRILPVTMSMNIIFKAGTPQSLKTSIRLDVKRKVKATIDRLDMGEEMIASQLYQEIRNVNQGIEDVIIKKVTIGSRTILVSNYKPHWDEKLFVKHIDDIEVF